MLRTFDAVRAAGKPVGVNAFDPAVAQSYLDAGAAFVLVGADVVAARARLRSARGAVARRRPSGRFAAQLLTGALRRGPAGATPIFESAMP